MASEHRRGKEGGPGQEIWRRKSRSLFHDLAQSKSHILETDEGSKSEETTH